jgi:CMP/dCMP kinase
MGFYIIAIDGPVGTGKSTTARILAEKLAIEYIDSGIYYRTVTYNILKENIKPNEKDKIIEITKNLKFDDKGDRIIYNNSDITELIKSLEVSNKVSSVSKIPEIRKIITGKLRENAKEKSLVVEGRDIGTVVFPEALFKFYIICDMNARAARRRQDFEDMGIKLSLENITKEISRRDEIDMKRAISPLKKAADAIEIDTTNMIVEEQIECLYKKIINSEEYRIFNNAV